MARMMTPEEAAVRSRILPIERPEREGWTCADCEAGVDHWDEDIDRPAFIVDNQPLCQWHADERVHEAIPYGRNCSECGVEHSALWPSGELA